MKPRQARWTQCALIGAAALWAYWPALGGDWIWDDAPEVIQNPLLRTLGGLARIWVAPESADYFPLKSTLQWAEWQIWGAHPLGYHLLSWALQIVAACLLWRLLSRLGLELAWVGGLIFAVHPVAVESVAWIAEMKNPLSLALLFAAISAFWDWNESVPGSAPGRVRYLQAWLAFVAALLCKSTVVMAPVFLLLYGWWRDRRITGRMLRATLPWFAAALLLGWVTLRFQQQRAIAGVDLLQGGFLARTVGAGRAGLFYLGKDLFPLRLLPIYPRWDLTGTGVAQLWPWLVLGAVAAVGWWQRAGWGRHLLLGYGWFLLNLIPVLGFLPMAYLRISGVADHLAYVSLAGIAGLAAAAIQVVRRSHPAAAWAVATVVVLGLSIRTHAYSQIFRNETRLWSFTLERNPSAWLAHNDLGRILLLEGKPEPARAEIQAALAIYPHNAEAHFNLGLVWKQVGQPAGALSEFQAAVADRPIFPEAANELGNALLAAKRPAEAEAQFRSALRWRPSDAEIHDNLGVALARQGRTDAAEDEFETALRLDAGLVPARNNLASTENNLGVLATEAQHWEEAVLHFETALRFRPDWGEEKLTLSEAQNNWGSALAQENDLASAELHFRAALRAQPDNAAAQQNLTRVLAMRP